MQTQAEPLRIIGRVKSPFREKFGIPRQPGLVDVRCEIELLDEFADPACSQGLEQFSHIWINFIFHQALKQGWKPKVRPPRLGGNQKLGVFASRSPFRPNHLGLSVAKLIELQNSGGRISLIVSGLDLVDQTPVVDIKPYIPYADSVPDADGGFAEHSPKQKLVVQFTPEARLQLPDKHFAHLVEQVLSLDPRPAYKHGEIGSEYGVMLGEFNVCWTMQSADQCLVTAILPTSGKTRE